MIKIDQIKLPISEKKPDLKRVAASILKIKKEDILDISIIRRSIDARKKPELYAIYSLCVSVRGEKQILKRKGKKQINLYEPVVYKVPERIERGTVPRPVIVGSGPAGLFCALLLAKCGLDPIVLERGEPVDDRVKTVNDFWKTGKLDTESNAQFGEGGAGTFSDGKLNTSVNDKYGRQRFVLEEFVRSGASEEILYSNAPHVGTDVLINVVRNIRNEIISNGGEFFFCTKMDDLIIKDDRVVGCRAGNTIFETDTVVLAIGHSSRDTFEMIFNKKLIMNPKPFAVGIRVQHPQKMINNSQFGSDGYGFPYPSPYKLTHSLQSGKGIYSFCMCPGGYVVNASSEIGKLAINGMSYSKRDSEYANSAIVVTVSPEDWMGNNHISGSNDKEQVMSGIAFQRSLETRAFDVGEGSIPCMTLGDFNNAAGAVSQIENGCFKGNIRTADIRKVFPEMINASITEGMNAFGRKIKGFDSADTVLSAVESRTSSPVRIVRNDELQSNISGIYPCGEGAGYAGGIMSAAIDGLKVAEKILERSY